MLTASIVATSKRKLITKQRPLAPTRRPIHFHPIPIFELAGGYGWKRCTHLLFEIAIILYHRL